MLAQTTFLALVAAASQASAYDIQWSDQPTCADVVVDNAQGISGDPGVSSECEYINPYYNLSVMFVTEWDENCHVEVYTDYGCSDGEEPALVIERPEDYDEERDTWCEGKIGRDAEAESNDMGLQAKYVCS